MYVCITLCLFLRGIVRKRGINGLSVIFGADFVKIDLTIFKGYGITHGQRSRAHSFDGTGF